VTVLFDRLFDDAALFPPGNAPMADAVPAHRELRRRLGDLVGQFVVPAARIHELTQHLGSGSAFGVSLIAAPGDLPAATQRIQDDPRLSLTAVEVPVVADAAATAQAVRTLDEMLPTTATAAVELPRTSERDEVLDVLAGTRYRAKLRTGGVRAELFPSSAELAGTLEACVSRGVRLKCTAGLHHAVRHTDPATGFEHHGFLNVLLAVEALTEGASAGVAEDWLQETDSRVLGRAVGLWSPADMARTRAVFTSFGTCSVLEPVEDLIALGLLSPTERISA
jgi:hypothetical protein